MTLPDCDGCTEAGHYFAREGGMFTDNRTGRHYCEMCLVSLLAWEDDGCPEPEEFPYCGWLPVGYEWPNPRPHPRPREHEVLTDPTERA